LPFGSKTPKVTSLPGESRIRTIGWEATAASVYVTTFPGCTVPCLTAAVVPVVKTMLIAAGEVVAIGWGVGLGGMAVKVGKDPAEVGVGKRGIGLGGMEVGVGRDPAEVGIGGMSVWEMGTERVHPIKSRTETTSGTKIKYGFVLEMGDFVNIELSFYSYVKSDYGIQI
jgi:hypothetical protein